MAGWLIPYGKASIRRKYREVESPLTHQESVGLGFTVHKWDGPPTPNECNLVGDRLWEVNEMKCSKR